MDQIIKTMNTSLLYIYNYQERPTLLVVLVHFVSNFNF